MNKKDIIEFFDSCAADWDAEMIIDTDTVNFILDKADITQNSKVLDVACGTGVLFPFYFQRKVSEVTGVDISSEMVKIAQSKFPQENVRILCGDVENTPFESKFDSIVVYNAFPHFPNPEGLIAVLSDLLEEGGTLTVAHGMSRSAIDHHHEGTASKVSMGLMSEEALAAIFAKHLQVTTVISNDRMYQVAGRK